MNKPTAMPMSKPTILIVDDSPLNVEILQEVLCDYNLMVAYNGDDAFRLALTASQLDLILLDVIMPGKDGYEVCRLLKENESTKEIPIIFITAQTDSDNVIKGFELGAVDYIAKPFNIPELMARVKTQLTIKRAHDHNEELLQHIESINKQLTDSISYAQKIQSASFPKTEYLDRIMPEYFVLLKPRDIVSGDFYWVTQMGHKLVVVAADCTGHGVPGAIMSMFGVAFLHQIVGMMGETSPALILDELRRVIIGSLQQSEQSEVKDGMDMSIVTIDADEKVLEYAGAFNPLFFIRDGQMMVIPSDSMPVSYGEIDRSFNNHQIAYLSGDCFYLFSDGFASQFGGESDKKLKQVGFRQLILENHALPMSKQKEVYGDFFEKWKGDRDQIDDVLLIGIRL